MKKQILLAILLLPALVSQAQITMDGQFKEATVLSFDPLPSGGMFFPYECSSALAIDGYGYDYGAVKNAHRVWIPHFKPNTKSVTIDVSVLIFDEFENKWESSADHVNLNCILTYDRKGRIVELYDTVWNIEEEPSSKIGNREDIVIDDPLELAYGDLGTSGIKDDWHSNTRYTIVYENDRIVKVQNGEPIKDIFSYKYDSDGHISKIKACLSTDEVYRIKWESQGYPAKVLSIKNALSTEEMIRSYEGTSLVPKISKNGKVLSYKNCYYNDKGKQKCNTIKFTKDEHGVATKIEGIQERGALYFENKYDADNNLIEQLGYRIVDGEKIYIIGSRFSYKYEFYK